MSDLRALISALPNPAVIVGHDSRVWFANGPAQQLLDKDCEGRHYVTTLRQPPILDAIEGALAKGDTIAPKTIRYLGKDGAGETTWNVIVSALNLSEGRAVLLSFQDITAVEGADEMRRDFVGNVSHELRTPLTTLVGFIETLRGPARNDPTAQDRFLAIMEQEAARMHNLIQDLLSLSRVEGQQRIRPTATISLDALIAEVVEALTPLAKARDVALVCDFPDTQINVLGDREQLWQVISNLTENAIKYGGTGKQVKLTLTPSTHQKELMQNGVRFSVADEGDGIPDHHIARLTERFYRVDSHRSREVGGTGLGLAIVKHIITRHRGRLRIQSEIGQGSEFTVIIPGENKKPTG